MKGFETVWTRVDGTGLRTRESARAVKDANGRLLYVEGVVEELPLQTPCEISDIDRNRILEAIAGNAQLDTIFDHITHIAESEMPGVRCCVTLITGDRLTVRSRGSVPVAFGEAIEAAGLCQDCGNPAVVAKLGEPVVAGDIEVHPCWGGLRELAREYRLRSCTSVPLLSSTNRVMGTLDVYRQHTHAPDASEFEHIESLARLAAIAVEHHCRMERLDAQHVTIDPLTRLPNRSAFEANLETAISAVRPGDAQLAVFWIDLDRLTSINDNLGHRAGDTLLKLVAARLVASFPHAMHMCRAGGDEFAVLFSLPQTADAVDAISAQLLQTFRDPFSVDGHDFVVTCSVGLAVFPEDGASAASLLRNSDAAMYRAKAWGKNTVERYRRAINNTGRRLDLENELRRACAHNELELFYQPQVDMDRRIDGLEALLRWRHPKHGLLPPAEFLPIAEETGLIVDPIGEWVLRNASKQFVKWEPNANPGMRIAVNVSAAQVYRTDLAAMVSRVIEQTGIRPENVELELTESVLMHNLEESVRKVQAVRSLGVSIAIDDFGTGYSSLSYLRQLPVDTLKIDKSFLDDVESRSGAALIRAISTLAKDLGLRVVAEGVETESQMALLSGLGIEHVQGYLISKPVPASEATKLIH